MHLNRVGRLSDTICRMSVRGQGDKSVLHLAGPSSMMDQNVSGEEGQQGRSHQPAAASRVVVAPRAQGKTPVAVSGEDEAGPGLSGRAIPDPLPLRG